MRTRTYGACDRESGRPPTYVDTTGLPEVLIALWGWFHGETPSVS